MINLFTEPGERAKAMGIFGFVAAGGGSIGVLLGGDPHRRDQLALDLPRQRPDRRRSSSSSRCRLLPDGARRAGRAARLDVGGAVTVTAALMLAVYAIVNGNEDGWTSAQTLGLLGVALSHLRRLPRHRGSGALRR